VARSLFDAAMPCIRCPVNRAGLGQLSVFKEAFHIIVQRALIAFKRQNVRLLALAAIAFFDPMASRDTIVPLLASISKKSGML
jgi:hypothetical protein